MNRYTPFLENLNKQTNEIVKVIRSWAELNSSSNNPEGLQKVLVALKKEFSAIPNACTDIIGKNRPSGEQVLTVTARPDAPIQILLVGHMDTVYPKESNFQKTSLEKDKLRGPGVTDMKGGLAVMLYALKTLEACPWKDQLGWRVMINQDEEIGSPYSIEAITFEAKTYHLGLCFEPSLPDGSLAKSRMGSGLITITANGKPAHAGRDFKKGVNAILLLSRVLQKIHKLNDTHPDTIANVGAIKGGGVVNIVPDFAEAKVNIRAKTPEALDSLLRDINTLETEHIKLDVHISRPPKVTGPSMEFIFHELQGCAQELDFSLDWKDTGGACDGNNLAHSGLPIIDNLGVQGDNIHSESEYLLIDSIPQRTQLCALFLMKLASGDIKLPEPLFSLKT